MPATWATPSTSPFLARPAAMVAKQSGDMVMNPSATAVLRVAGFSPTSTMTALPAGSMCVSSIVSPLYNAVRDCSPF